MESRSRRSHLQKIATQEQEPDLTHSKVSRSRRTSSPPQQLRSRRNRVRSSAVETTKHDANDEGTDDPGEQRGTSTKESHSKRRGMQWRTRRSFDKPPPPEHPPHITTTATSRTPAASSTTVKEGGIDDPKGARGRSTTRISPMSHMTQSRSEGSPDESPHAHLTTAKTATQKRRSASTTTQNGDQTNSPTSSGTKTRFEESKQTPGSTSTRRTTSTFLQSQEGRDTVGQADSRSENSSQDPEQYTTSRTIGDASGPTTP